ncbi:uncharacterized protein KQ657_003613 [Scheffersomyces spartinae]|uniref:Protein DCG1 n=1 Tax=Scheffersomyces spartinae TaxID=45513 RepID=A0A9P7V4Z0_9ASCO|nr:uncharacterized protein KQ657_003613 [Scheffersomyces spartinae]KAG7191275.1 hypothetical protein KQ657_003613 [Scheffersomyces spartinae]
MFKFLIINPNSSKGVTDNLETILPKVPGTELIFYTAPAGAPKEITGVETSIESEKYVLEDIKAKKLADEVDGFLVCCYSDHPLIYSLSKLTPDKPVLGIMQATLLYSLLNPTFKLFILTSTSEWEPLLDDGIQNFLGTSEFPHTKFFPTLGLNISVLDLALLTDTIVPVVKEILSRLDYAGCNCILLGCAGLSGADKVIERETGVKCVDSVRIGVEFLNALARNNTY